MAQGQKFKNGELVQLKSGGPVMTVESLEMNQRYYCKWFAGSKLNNGYFDSESLMLAPSAATGS